jgi:transcription initiation factor TFIIF subunit beta
MADPAVIKAEPDESNTPAAEPIDEEDLYEDAGDLEFYDKNAAERRFETLYMSRVPKYMWDAWQKLTERLGDNDEIQIGTLRTWNEQSADGTAQVGAHHDTVGFKADCADHSQTKLRMLLHPNCPEHQLLPREYDMEVLDANVNNHFIFSEEDLPGFKARSKARAEAANQGIPASLLKPKSEHTEKRTYDRRSRYQPYYRKAVPSRSPSQCECSSIPC